MSWTGKLVIGYLMVDQTTDCSLKVGQKTGNLKIGSFRLTGIHHLFAIFEVNVCIFILNIIWEFQLRQNIKQSKDKYKTLQKKHNFD